MAIRLSVMLGFRPTPLSSPSAPGSSSPRPFSISSFPTQVPFPPLTVPPNWTLQIGGDRDVTPICICPLLLFPLFGLNIDLTLDRSVRFFWRVHAAASRSLGSSQILDFFPPLRLLYTFLPDELSHPSFLPNTRFLPSLTRTIPPPFVRANFS